MVKPQPPQDVLDSWPTQNLVNPEYHSHTAFLGITLAMTILTMIVISLRTYVRFFMLRAPGWDDYFIFIAAIADIGLLIVINLGILNYGWDRHQWDQRPEWFQVSELIQYLTQICFIILMTFSKLSALVTYLRASSRTKYNRFVWATMIIVALWGISFLFATIFQCTPIHLYWTSKDGKGCTNEDIRLLLATVVNIITDIMVVLMPIPIIMKLHFPLREKITLGILMCLGMVATVASIVRTVVMSQSLNTLRYDTTWNSFVVWIWLSLECNLAIICISVPVLRVLARRLLPQYWGPSGSRSGGYAHTYGAKTMHSHHMASTTHVPREAKHASFTSLETKALKDTDDIEMYGIRRTDSLKSYSYPDPGYGHSQTSMNSRIPEAGEYHHQHHYRPPRDDHSRHAEVARAI
ncbi:hypothetical protein BT63DRAFT_66879 [Microthyrium microscopicum]|uniref:Rhodopsin domain-containing protein n=1 Tax=Microthyrium microscopicum TaxID=703497 RepID=A0A6A6U1K3_9PEZI|nr:hypothetical protein BT63DRAFT_66879 [Microthyrium microscopicum]